MSNTLPLVAALLVLLVLLARTLGVYPHRRLIFLALVPGLASIALVRWPDFFWSLMMIDGVAAGLALADLVTLPRKEVFSVSRTMGVIASLKKPHRVTLTVANEGNVRRMVEIRDGAVEELHAEPDEFLLELAPRSRAVVHYELRPARRGRFEISQAYVRASSRWGLWQRMFVYPTDTASQVSVYPDMKQLGEFDLLARTNRLSLMGVRRTRKIGQDNEFERLRDYTLDDNYKHIDWRATARRNKLTVKDFQANQSQRVIFLVDCGRMMTNLCEGISLLDHALNAMLMMSFVALRQGDQVGLVCFSDEIHHYVPPQGGMGQMNRILHAAHDRFPRLVESRYDEAFLYLASHCRKRAMVVLVTNVIDDVNAHQIQQYLANLVGRHLPLGLLLRDHHLFDAVAAGEAENLEALPDDVLFPAAAAADVLTWRHQVMTDLQAKGVLVLDVFPEDMTAPLVNQYLEVKARHLL